MICARVNFRILLLAASCAITAATPAFAQPGCPDAGMVVGQRRITQSVSGFSATLNAADLFGVSVAAIGDVDGDGVVDLSVGASQDDTGGGDRGAVWILFMNTDGTVRTQQKIASGQGGFTGGLDNGDRFGVSVAALGDIDGDGVPDLAAGAFNDDDGGTDRGAVWILFLNPDGTVRAHQKISSTQGGFAGGLDNVDWFGFVLAAIGDLDGDGVVDLAVAAQLDDDGGSDRGAVWILFLNLNGTVKAKQKISSTQGGFTGILDNSDRFGLPGELGDLDGDGVLDLVVGAFADDDGGADRGAVWILFLNPNGTVRSHQKISDTQGGFTGLLDDLDNFGIAASSAGDLDADGITDLLVGVNNDGDGGLNRGAVWVLFLNLDGTVRAHQKISQTSGGFTEMLLNGANFGRSVTRIGDLNGDGQQEIAVGAIAFEIPTYQGEFWILSLSDCVNAPSLVSQPDSVLLPQAGGEVTLSVAAAGSPTLEYRWRRDGVDLVDGGHVSGASTPTLTIGATRADIGFYDCVVSNKTGSVTSRAALLGLRLDCLADFNNDGVVNSTDVSDFINAWFENQAGCP